MVTHDTGEGPSDYEEITRRNIEHLGTKPGTRKSQVSMYADTAHFVFELLQNADDKGATEIHFAVTDDALIVEHNGALFRPEDVGAISYFGEGNPDRTKIGHFGLGFKSVFAYTASPRIHSGAESFVLLRLYTLQATPYPADLPHGRTRFVLPFDHLEARPEYLERRDWKSLDTARDEITRKLKHLGAETLLFTASLAEIDWEAGNDRGHYLRGQRQVAPSIREVYLLDEDREEQPYLVFDRAIEWADEDEDEAPQRRRPVEIAFQLTRHFADGGDIVPLEQPSLFVFFPTEKNAGVGFILQGPYRTTPARDNVPAEDTFNRHLVAVSADLLVEALRWLRDNGRLTLEVLRALPLEKPPLGFEPLHNEFRAAILREPFLPTAEGGYVAATEAKLARGAGLVDLFSPDQLSALFRVPIRAWITPSLTEDRYGPLHGFLAGKKAGTYGWPLATSGLVSEIEVDPGDIARRIDAAFMAAQPDEWVSRLYAYLSDGPARVPESPHHPPGKWDARDALRAGTCPERVSLKGGRRRCTCRGASLRPRAAPHRPSRTGLRRRSAPPGSARSL